MLGRCLRSIRLESGLSLRGLAERSGYSRSFISAVESGQRMPGAFALDCLIRTLSAEDKRSEINQIFAHEYLGSYQAKEKSAC